jgi:glutaredoxin
LKYKPRKSMNHALKLASLLLLCAASAHAQLYKWVGPDGKISYSNTPPPPSATRVETTPLPNSASDTVDLPYALAQAVKNSPVTLYTTVSCIPCDDGRKLLAARGVPFTEKTVNTGEDSAQFRKIAGDEARLPLLIIGRNQQRGFEPGAWNSALSAAAYPETSTLPKTWRNPPAQAAAPSKPVPVQQTKTADASASESTSNRGELPAPVGNAPPGFRF